MSVLSFFGVKPVETASSGADTIRRIAGELDRLPPDRARYVAAFAYVLSRVARADQDVSASEVETMERLVREKAGLEADQAALVVQMAKAQQLLFGGTDDFLVTRELSRSLEYSQKLTLVDCLFAVAAADREIRSAEADEIGRIARELRVEPSDLSNLRSAYRDHLVVRRGLGEA